MTRETTATRGLDAPGLGFRLGVLDCAAAAGAVFLPMFLRYGGAPPPEHLMTSQAWFPVLLACRLAAAQAFGLYDLRRRLQASDHVFGGMAAAGFGVLPGYLAIALVQLYYLPLAQFSRAVVLGDLLVMMLWFGASRAAALGLLRRGGYRLRIATAGAGADRAALAGELRRHAPPLAAPAGDWEPGGDAVFAEWLARETPDVVLLETGGLEDQHITEVITACDAAGVEVWVCPGLRLALFGAADVFSLGGIPLIRLNGAGARPWQRAVKRWMDLAGAAAGLVLLSPLLALAALAVRMESGGPVLFFQERLGLGGAPFRLVKFRSMRADAEAVSGPVLAEADDPRVTRVGRWLRRTRVDELPQLWNVLRGEMSLVGPRPERPEFAGEFLREEPLYRHRFVVKPGMTGLAQVHGRYDTDYRQKLRYDLIYIGGMSLGADLRIIAATLRSVLTARGAR